MNNKRDAILYGVSALCSALVFAFFALPFYTELFFNVSGYDFLSHTLQTMGSAAMMDRYAAIIALALLIVAGLTFVTSIVLVICKLDVIKNETITAFFTWATRYLTRALASFAVLNLIFCILVAHFISHPTSSSAIPVPTKAGWALGIIVLVLGIITCAITAYIQFKAKQEKGKEKTEQPKEEK